MVSANTYTLISGLVLIAQILQVKIVNIYNVTSISIMVRIRGDLHLTIFASFSNIQLYLV